MNHFMLTGRSLAAVAAGVFVFAVGVTPAAAVPDPGQYRVAPTISGSCALERIGTQFVRCDHLTGAGSPAPSFVPERR